MSTLTLTPITPASVSLTTPTELGVTIQPNAVGTVPLTIKGVSGQTGDLQRWEKSDGTVFAKLNGEGRLFLGAAAEQAIVRWRGNVTYENTAGFVWETGIDVANEPTYADFVLAARGEAVGVLDWVYIKNGRDTSNSPALGIGSVGGSSLGASTSNPSFLRIARNTTAPYVTNDAAWHNLVLSVRDSTSPVQTGYAIAVSRENNAMPFVVTALGETLTRKITNLNLTDSQYWTNDEAGALISPVKSDGKGVVIKGLASQTDNLLEIASSGNTVLSGFDKFGYWFNRRTSAPADADISASEVKLWFDSTDGAAKLMVKGKSANGTVVSGEVALS